MRHLLLTKHDLIINNDLVSRESCFEACSTSEVVFHVVRAELAEIAVQAAVTVNLSVGSTLINNRTTVTYRSTQPSCTVADGSVPAVDCRFECRLDARAVIAVSTRDCRAA